MKYLQNVSFMVVGALLASFASAIPRPDIETSADPIADSYIVVFKETASKTSVNKHISWLKAANEQLGASRLGGEQYNYNIGSFKGYAGQFNELIVESIKSRPEIAFVERNGVVKASDCVSQYINLTQDPWGLARVSNRHFPAYEFLYDDSRPMCNAPLYAYVLDSGARVMHKEFEGRASLLFKAEENSDDGDVCGHGTHVAAIIAGKTYGVNKAAGIFVVKVLNGRCSGTWAGVLAGLDAAYNHAGPANRPNSVVNMSLGGPISQAMNLAVENCVSGNMTVVTAAGNSAGDACYTSPASAPGAITVGATNISDAVPWWSNVGCCVDVYAPGEDVLSAISSNDTATGFKSGTSMASPHVTGIILYNKCRYGFKTPKEDKEHLIGSATNGTLAGNTCVKGCCSPNLLVFNGGCGYK